VTCGWQTSPKFSQSATIGLVFAGIIAFLVEAGWQSFGIGATFGPAVLAAIPALATAPASAVAGGIGGAALVFGFVLGWAIGKQFHLKSLSKDPICVSGVADNVDNSEDSWYLSIFWDPDRSIDLAVRSTPMDYVHFIVDHADLVNCNELQTPLLHMEINSHVGPFARWGGVVGAAAGAVVGSIVGILAAIAIGSAACGVFFFLCFLAALLVAAIVAAIITAIGAWVGGVAGGAIGKIADAGDPLLKQGDMVHDGTCLTAKGPWVNDLDHGWNELHPITQLILHGDFSHLRPYAQSDADSSECVDDCPAPAPPPPR
jgi:hypothetical protein